MGGIGLQRGAGVHDDEVDAVFGSGFQDAPQVAWVGFATRCGVSTALARHQEAAERCGSRSTSRVRRAA